MKQTKIKILDKEIDNNKIILLISGIFLVFALTFLIIGDNINVKSKDKAPLLNSVSKENTYSRVESQFLLEPIAQDIKNKNYKFYYVIDKNNYYYIVKLSNKKFKELSSLYNYTYNGGSIPSVKILTGKAKIIDEDLKKLSIDFYNTFTSSSTINKDNFNSYIGAFYLDTNSHVIISIFLIIFGSIFGLIGIVILLIYIKCFIRTKKTLKNFNLSLIDRVKTNISNSSTKVYLSDRLILTNDLFINNTEGLRIEKNKNISEVKLVIKKFSKYFSVSYLRVTLINKKKHYIITKSSFTNKGLKEYENVFVSLSALTPEAMHKK